MQPTIWTIGHSNRPLDEFLRLLAEFGIEAVADVRRFPGSRRQPQYSGDTLRDTLAAESVEYLWLPSLGGRRAPAPDSPNTVWRNASFRGYADYLHTEEFAGGLAELVNLACGMPTAMLCAEAVWWRCHRSLIADVLCSLGIRVVHILGPGTSALHPYTAPARLVDGMLTYQTG